MSISTPAGTRIGLFAMRDMSFSQTSAASRHDAEDFAALAGRTRGGVGHDAFRRADHRNAKAVLDLRQFVLATILAQAGAADAFHGLDDAPAVHVTQGDLQYRLAF